MPIMTTHSFARVGLLAFAGVIGGCGSSELDPYSGKGCRVDAQCGPHGVCVQEICVVFREDADLYMRTADYRIPEPPPPDFATSDDRPDGDICPSGTKRCG